MEESKVNELFLDNKNYIPSEKQIMFKKALTNADDSAYDEICIAKRYNPTTILLLSIFLGGFGVDRFVLGDIGLGVGKLLLGWLTFGIWPLIDIFFSYKKAKEKNYINLASCLA